MTEEHEVDCEEWNGDDSISLSQLAKLIPVLQEKYGVKSRVRFDAGYNNVSVMITPTSRQRIRKTIK
jgi:hypothetical protein